MNAENRAPAVAGVAAAQAVITASVYCKRHPKELVVGVCAICLRERLASVDPADRQTKGGVGVVLAEGKPTSSGKKQPTNIFQKKKPNGASSSSIGPELRRSKSFSEGRFQARAKIESSQLEPKRKSCDIRVRNTLWSLFQIDQEQPNVNNPDFEEARTSMELNGWFNVENATKEEECLKSPEKEEPRHRNPEKAEKMEIVEVEDEEEEEEEDAIEIIEEVDQVKTILPPQLPAPLIRESESCRNIVYNSYETGESSSNVLRTIKSHIDQDAQIRNAEEKKSQNPQILGSNVGSESGDSKDKSKTFWLTEMVMKRIQKWKKRNRQKHRHPQRPKAVSRDTRSEIFDDASRPSCEDDPRFSIDIGRTSWEDSRASWDEPRASWDGILIGRLLASTNAIHEETNNTGLHHPHIIPSIRNHFMPLESNSKEETLVQMPGGCADAREYYARKKRCEKAKAEEDKSLESSKNITKVSPEEENMKPYLEMQDEDDVAGSQKQVPSKSHKWTKAWSKTIANPMWGFIQKKNGKDEEVGGDSECNEAWREFPRDKDPRRGLRKGDVFSHSSISSRTNSGIQCNAANGRNPLSTGNIINRCNSNSSAQRNKNVNGCQRKREEIMLDRSRSVHISSNNGDNGLLRFYLTPLRSSSSRRNSTGNSSRIRPPLSSSRSALLY